MIAEDGRLIALDFGAVAELPEGIPPNLGHILRLARDDEYDRLAELLRIEGFIPDGYSISPVEIREYLAPYAEPLRSESFHFTRKWLLRTSSTALDPRGPHFQTGRMLSLPPQYLMIFRVLLGTVGICSQMETTVPYREIMDRWT
jgi:predicted unusual protein kinase regulating ubiquinone biosynthesis (AarF/ABC1/UbiB family)